VSKSIFCFILGAKAGKQQDEIKVKIFFKNQLLFL
jgi:hypothetical protein